MIRILLFTAFILFTCLNKTAAQCDFISVGPNDFNQPSYSSASSTGAVDISFVLDKNNHPSVLFVDDLVAQKATVRMHNGITWTTIDTAGFSAGQFFYPTLAISKKDTLYSVYSDYTQNSRATVKKYDGLHWITVGTEGFSVIDAGDVGIRGAEYTSIALDTNGTPYIAYCTDGGGKKAHVMKFDGINWVSVDIAGFSVGQAAKINISFDKVTNTPYVVYYDFGVNVGYSSASKHVIKKFNGISWDLVGQSGFAPGVSSNAVITNDLNGVPYVMFNDGTKQNKISVMKFNGTAWVYVGLGGISVGGSNSNSISTDMNGTPYITYSDITNNDKIIVKSFNGSTWVNVGAAGFSQTAAIFTSIELDNSGTPYVTYKEAYNGKVVVMKYNGTSWVVVGDKSISESGAAYINMDIDKQNNPYIIYKDFNVGDKATVKKYNGTSWQQVGTSQSIFGVEYPSIAIDTLGTPYIIYTDNYNAKAYVNKYNGTNWVPAGSLSPIWTSVGPSAYTSIAIDLNNTPYIVYNDVSYSNKATVLKLVGTSWVNVGPPAITVADAISTTIGFDNTNTPYIAFADGANGYKATVLKFNGTLWVTVGIPGFSLGQVSYPAISFDPNGIAYLTCTDAGNNNSVTIYKLSGTNWVALPNITNFIGFTYSARTSMDFDRMGNPYVAFGNGPQHKVILRKFDGTAWNTIGSGYFSSGTADYISLALDTNDVPYVAYSNEDVYIKKFGFNTSASVTNTICEGSSIYFNASGATTYSWSGINGFNSSIQNPVIANATSLNTGIYNLTMATAYCSVTNTFTVNINSGCQDVWPGDANSDGTADNIDVLELGLHYTQTGAPRATISTTWQSYFANNWIGTITNGKNLNHSDCNGDGIINDNDTLAIYTNYGLTHAFKPTQTNTVNPQLSIVPDQVSVVKGTWGTASIYLGDATTNINNINGVAFTVDFDNTLIEQSNIYIEYLPSFIDASQNLHFRKLDFSNNKIYTATTHTVSNNVSGFGKIATLHYQIKSSLSSDQVLNLGISQANQSDASGAIIPLTSGTGTLLAIGSSVGLQELNGNVIYVSPNPTNGSLTIHSKTELQKIEVMSVDGKILLNETPANVSHTLHLDNFTNGIYFVNVFQNNRIVKREKIVLNK